MMALGGFFLIFEAVSRSFGPGRGPRWDRGERRCWGGRARSRGRPRRRRRGAGVSDALEAFSGGRRRAGRVDSTASRGAGPEASGALFTVRRALLRLRTPYERWGEEETTRGVVRG